MGDDAGQDLHLSLDANAPRLALCGVPLQQVFEITVLPEVRCNECLRLSQEMDRDNEVNRRPGKSPWIDS